MKLRSPATRPILLVLLLVLGIATLLLLTRGSRSPASGLQARLKSLTIEPQGAHAHLILTAAFRQSGSGPLHLTPPVLTLLAADGQPVPAYLGPLLPEPVLKGAGPADLSLHYWIPLTRLTSPLTLDVSGTAHPIPLTRLPAPGESTITLSLEAEN